jgi:hypothetical protein
MVHRPYSGLLAVFSDATSNLCFHIGGCLVVAEEQ